VRGGVSESTTPLPGVPGRGEEVETPISPFRERD
jgi:hypothetical protein